jgi:ribulose-5-phosphate 4-epimerase/fuculose-1-phosphate aldolase
VGDNERIKETIVEAARALVAKGFLMATGGNISHRVPGREAFAVTPSNYDYMRMESGDVCVLGLDMETLEGRLPPSVEAAMHAAIYLARPDVQAIIHTHQVYASALALVGSPIPGLFDEQIRFLGRGVSIIPYAPSGTGMLKRQVARHVKNHDNAYIMKNHGALVFGHDMERAVHNVEILEKCSIAYLLALATGRRAGRVPLAIREIAFSKLRGDQKRAAAGETNRGGE